MPVFSSIRHPFIQLGPGIRLAVVLLCACSMGMAAGRRKKDVMSMYPRKYADYRQSSFQNTTVSLKGEIGWFQQTTDTIHHNAPGVILSTESGLVIQYPDKLRFLRFDGTPEWERDITPGYSVTSENGLIYFRATNMSLGAVDMGNKVVLDNFYVYSSSPFGFFPLAVPIGPKNILCQAINRGMQVDAGDKPEKDNTNFVLMGRGDWEWHVELEGETLPGLLTNEKKRVIVPCGDFRVRSIDVATGKSAIVFSLQGMRFLAASLDTDENLVMRLRDTNGKNSLAAYTLDPAQDTNKEPLWSTGLGAVTTSPYTQPPVVGSENRIHIFYNNNLLAVDAGKIVWKKPVPQSEQFQYTTILADNSLLLVSANVLLQLNRNGEETAHLFLEPNEAITTPPVAGPDGSIYIGTAKGIYSVR